MFLSAHFPSRDLLKGFKEREWGRHCSPQDFYPLTGALAPWFAAASLLLCALGLFVGLVVAPAETQQGEACRIMFIHLPAALISVLIYLLLALGAGAGLVFNARLPPMLAQALAPTGAMFALLTLWSGSLWARPVLGVWWVWDTHLISEFVLLSLYAGFIVLQTGMDDAPKGDKFGAALAIAGIVNVPINVLSVEWWTTLHQGVSISSSSQPGMTTSMLAGTLVMAAAFFLYSCAVAMLRLRCVILERERDSEWVAKRGNASP